jgi:hypothetical protein
MERRGGAAAAGTAAESTSRQQQPVGTDFEISTTSDNAAAPDHGEPSINTNYSTTATAVAPKIQLVVVRKKKRASPESASEAEDALKKVKESNGGVITTEGGNPNYGITGLLAGYSSSSDEEA